MSIDTRRDPPWLVTVLLAEDDTEESVMGSDWHQEAIFEAHGALLSHAEERAAEGVPPWYVSSQVTVIVELPRRLRPWRPKPDLFVVVGAPAAHRSSYDTRRDGPMPQFVLEVASESTWQQDVDEKRDLYARSGVREYVVFDPVGEYLPERLRAWRASASELQPWLPVARRDGIDVWRSEILQLELRVNGPLLHFDDPARGPLLLRRETLERWRAADEAREAAEQARDGEREAKEAAEQARGAAEQRARTAEETLAFLRHELLQRESNLPGPISD